MAKSRLLLNLLAVAFYVDSFEVIRKHERERYPANKDTFQKGVYIYGKDIINITKCTSDYVDGTVSDAINDKKMCQCGYGQTFYIDTKVVPPRPKCIVGFGDKETGPGCKFKFKGQSNVLALRRNRDNRRKIETIQYNGNDVVRIEELRDVYIWNVTWQIQQQILFSDTRSSLQWMMTNIDEILARHQGLLFKVNMTINRQYDPKTVTGCVLLKIDGERNYPLVPYVERSSRNDYISSTRKLPGLSTFKVMPSSSNVVISTSLPIQKSKTSQFASTPSTSKTTSITTSTQKQSKAVTSSPSRPIFQTSSTQSSTTRPLKTAVTSYLTNTPSKSTVSLKTQGSSFAIQFSSSYENYNTRISTQIKSPNVVASSTASRQLPTSSIITNPGGNTGKQASSNAGKIAGISVGVIVAIAAIVAAVVIIYRRRHPSANEIRRRKGTMTLDLTSNSFSNRGLSFQNPVKNNVGNPMYGDRLRFNSVSANGKSDTELYEYAYDNGKNKNEEPGEAIYKEIDEDGKMEPIYREIEGEEPIYHETESEYQPIDETKLDSPVKYEALNTASLPEKESSNPNPVQAPIYQELEEENIGEQKDKTKDKPSDSNPVQAPIYQVLEEENEGKHKDNGVKKNDVQSPVYQTLNPEVYEELDRNGAKSPDNVYSKLDLAAKNGPNQVPLYDVLARESGTSNSQYDDDEAEI